MPNLLAHYGVQGPLSRAGLPAVDLKWILAGCLLPDLPWILQRAAKALLPGLVDPYQLRLYVAVQASLLFCLLLALAVAQFAERPGPVLAVLALNALLHLVLDGLQTKWATDVHLAAPLRWEGWSPDLFWPESVATLAMTAAGVAFFGWAVSRRAGGEGIRPCAPPIRRGAVAAAALLAYGALPLAFTGGAGAAGTHYVDVLRGRTERTGRYLELDRTRYVDRAGGDVLRTFAGEEIRVRGADLDRSATVSVRGRFVAPDELRVTALHVHRSGLRDLASYVGLALLVGVWWRDPGRGP